MTTSTRPMTFDDMMRKLSEPQVVENRSLIDGLLLEQQTLTAVDLFSNHHTNHSRPDQEQYYKALLPATPPGPGQQYAFEVDLDRCSGCKSCVTACHSLNGLDPGETWRDVGLLVGGTESLPMMQHVTAACHHCLQPACMIACPVNAYQKDSITGIVKHLDDQCFGCQYCTLACPYHVPKYHHAKGIVRKCDMCSNRLAQGEAPACVQACPHEAIAIKTVAIQRVIEDSETNNFLPGAPEPYLTLPTTTYKTKRVFPRNMLPADYYSIHPEHPHWPLILMLVLTQLSVGAFIIGFFLDATVSPDLATNFRPFHATNALLLGLLALSASTCHLGRPLYAFRGFLGFMHSWLSREIVFFGLFAGLAIPYAAACWVCSPSVPLGAPWADALSPWLHIAGGTVAAAGILGVFCSAMIYIFTQRELWSFGPTMLRFALTSVVLGAAASLMSILLLTGFIPSDQANRLIHDVGRPMSELLIGSSCVKLVFDALLLRHLASRRMSAMKRSALLVCGALSTAAFARVGLGILGGIAMPAMLLDKLRQAPDNETGLVLVITVFIAGQCCFCGELAERYIFFAAVSSPRMPGGVRP